MQVPISFRPMDTKQNASQILPIVAVANLFAHNNLWLCYYVQVNK